LGNELTALLVDIQEMLDVDVDVFFARSRLHEVRMLTDKTDI
jgi:hypothetical protein